VLELKYGADVESGRSMNKTFSGQFSYGLDNSTHTEDYVLCQTESAINAATVMDDVGTNILLLKDSYRHVIVGRVSERHFCHHIMKDQLHPETPAEQVMKSGIVGLDLSCRVERAINLMFRHHVRHLPVFDGSMIPEGLQAAFSKGNHVRGLPEDAFVGVVDIADVVFAYANKISHQPDRDYCSSITVQSMLDYKLRDRSAMDVYAMKMEGTTVDDLMKKIQGKHNIGSQVGR